MMGVGAAVRITSPDATRVLEHAAELAAQRGETCYLIAVVTNLAYDKDEAEAARATLERAMELRAVPIIQEGVDVAQTLLAVARGFGIDTLVLSSGRARSAAERLLHLHPPFDVIVIGSR